MIGTVSTLAPNLSVPCGRPAVAISGGVTGASWASRCPGVAARVTAAAALLKNARRVTPSMSWVTPHTILTPGRRIKLRSRLAPQPAYGGGQDEAACDRWPWRPRQQQTGRQNTRADEEPPGFHVCLRSSGQRVRCCRQCGESHTRDRPRCHAHAGRAPRARPLSTREGSRSLSPHTSAQTRSRQSPARLLRFR
jgi:hypothetical protein